MLRKTVIGLSIASLCVALVVAVRGELSSAQPGQANANRISQPAGEPLVDSGKSILKPSNPLPISQVVLFNSGVGYFHRTGMVEGDAQVDLQFQAGDINDLIKSLVIDDTGGKVLPLRYDSQEPIEKTLRSFAINLSTNPSFGQILNQARGEKVELTLVSNNTGLPGTLTGTIIGMESAHRLPTPTATATAEMELVNLMCAEGLRTVPINQVQRLRFLNPAIESELRRALDVVAGGHDSQKKSVRLGFHGEGRREVNVGYVTENPIWKTSYRIVLGKDGKTKLLGWANIENTSDEDWHDVKLTLVSGRPISFQMDLYPPLFIPRPTVEPELFASLRPPTYAGPMSSGFGLGQFGGFGANGAGGPFNGGGGGIQFGGGGGLAVQGFQGGPQIGMQGLGGNTAFPTNSTNWTLGNGQMQMQQALQNQAQISNGSNSLGQMPGTNLMNLNRFQNNDALNYNFQPNSRVTWNELQQRREIKNKDQQQQATRQAKQIGSILTGIDPNLVEGALTAEELGNPARFVIEEKVTLPRQQSAMIPILEQPIEAARVSIYNSRVQAKHPLFGLKIKNNSKQSLMQGPIAIYQDEQYAGDARILDLQAGEERFVSYAIDTGTEVLPFDKVVPGPEMTARMENGRLQVQYKLRTTRTYIIKNRSPEERKVVIEQPVRDGWKFTESRKSSQTAPAKKGDDGVEKEATWAAGDKEKPSERTRDLYRFTVDVKAGETVKYEVSEELPRIDPFESTRNADWTGFATTLGLDVWTDSNRTPENSFGLEVADNVLKVTHKDRRTTTYHIKNRGDVERMVWLEHFVAKNRKLVGDVKPEGEEGRRYRFKLPLKPGEIATQTVVEEFESARPEAFALKTGAYPSNAKGEKGDVPETGDLPADRFITDLGFEVWQTRTTHPETLISGKFVKGELQTEAKNQETVTYIIRPLDAAERTFVVDHHVRPSWSHAGDEKPVQGRRNCYRFTVHAAKDQLIKHDVAEEKISPRRESLQQMSDERIKALLSSDGLDGAVKENIRKGTSMIKALAQTKAVLLDLRGQLKEITDEQGRIKGNLEKLPTSSELYKRLIDKFDKQETALEKVQAQIGDRAAAEKSQKKEYDAFLQMLNE